eukprot:g18063.t1
MDSSDDDDFPPGLVPAEEIFGSSSLNPKQASSLDVDVDVDVCDGTSQQPGRPSAETAPAAGAVPVTIVTGFLGAGKTTLLNYILTQDHGRRIAVIENEVGDSMDIESLIARDGADGSVLADNLFELNNGCICCTVKDDLVSTLETLLKRRNKFDYVIIETTGLANPGPVASVFWLDEALESALRLDSIVTLVDAKNFSRQLRRTPEDGNGDAEGDKDSAERPQNEAAMQVAYADRVLINKSDLVPADVLDDVKAQVRAINAVAEVRCTKRSAVDLSWILDTKCFSAELALAVDPSLGSARAPSSTARANKGDERGVENSETINSPGISSVSLSEAGNGEVVAAGGAPGTTNDAGEVGGQARHHDHSHQHANGESCGECSEELVEGPGGKACSVHDASVTTCAVDLAGSLDLSLLERWLGRLLWEPPPGGAEVYRVKGVVSVEGRDERFVVQGVADLFEVTPAGVVGSAWVEGEARRCKVVFIGRMLSKRDLERGFMSCMIED